MGIWLFSAILLQFACAICAARLDRPVVWLQVILLVPVLGSVAYCGFEIMLGLARVKPSRPAAVPARAALGRLGYQAVQARTTDSRRALAEECLRIGRHADAKLLFEGCMVGRHSQDPRLIAGLERATALMGISARPTGTGDEPERPVAS